MSAPDTQVTLSLPVLQRGHLNEPIVERLQFLLNHAKGIDELILDGIFGPKTEAAVRWFQGNANLAVDGVVGRQTWTTLLPSWLFSSGPG